MNVFKDFESLITFSSFDSITDFKRLARKISDELGEDKFLLSKYLSEVFEVLSHIDLNMVTHLANETCSEVLKDCYRICDSGADEQGKYSSLVEKYINENPIGSKDSHAKVEYYASRILLEHLEIFADDFATSLKEKLQHVSFSKLNKYYKSMAEVIGEKRMEYLNDLICEAFCMSPAGVAFVGQITVKCIEMFIYRDSVSNKQVFEFIAEEC